MRYSNFLLLRWCWVVLLVGGLAGASEASRAESTGRWVSTWVSAQQLTEPHNLPPPPGLAGHTLRQVVQPTLAGTRLRLMLSNEFGETPLVIGALQVAYSAGGSAIEESSGRAVTFDGRRGVTLQPGTKFLSDEVDLPVVPFRNLAVSLLVTEIPTRVTGHPGSRTTSYLQAGDHVSAYSLPGSTEVERWYLLAAIDVYAVPHAAAIVVLGDSITDGRGSTTNQNDRWPNLLARRLHRAGAGHLAVLNQGAGGGRVLREGLGLSALARFDRDVIAVPGVRTLVVFIGVNDLGTAVAARHAGEPGATAEELIAAFRQMIRRAQSHGIRVVGATIMPFGGYEPYFTPESEADRQRINQWIRTSGELSGVIDFDAIARDPQEPQRLHGAFDGGDHLHPSAAGYRLMAEAIDLTTLRE